MVDTQDPAVVFKVGHHQRVLVLLAPPGPRTRVSRFVSCGESRTPYCAGRIPPRLPVWAQWRKRARHVQTDGHLERRWTRVDARHDQRRLRARKCRERTRSVVRLRGRVSNRKHWQEIPANRRSRFTAHIRDMAADLRKRAATAGPEMAKLFIENAEECELAAKVLEVVALN